MSTSTQLLASEYKRALLQYQDMQTYRKQGVCQVSTEQITSSCAGALQGLNSRTRRPLYRLPLAETRYMVLKKLQS